MQLMVFVGFENAQKCGRVKKKEVLEISLCPYEDRSSKFQHNLIIRSCYPPPPLIKNEARTVNAKISNTVILAKKSDLSQIKFSRK